MMTGLELIEGALRPPHTIKFRKENGGRSQTSTVEVYEVDKHGYVVVTEELLENILLEIGFLRVEESDDLEPST